MATRYMLFAKAALVVVRLTNGTRANIPQGRAVPESIHPDDAARLVDEGYLERVEIVDDVAQNSGLDDGLAIRAGATDAGRISDPNGEPSRVELTELDDAGVVKLLKGKAEDVLDTVGDDAVLAARLLEVEQAKAKPRVGLVAGLEETIAAADDDEEADPDVDDLDNDGGEPS